MKTFLDAWLLEAPMGLSQELAGTVKVVAAGTWTQAAETLCLKVELQGAFRGSFWVTAEPAALARLFVAARITPAETDIPRDTALWQGIIRQVAERAAKAVSRDNGAPTSVVTVQQAALPTDLSWTAFEIRFGETSAHIALSDGTKPVDEKKQEKSGTNNFPVRGVELFLDVELEASLRFGSREMPLSEVLDLGPGDVVQLERHVSDPVDLIVGDKIVARGEVVLVNGNFGLRVTEVAEPRKSLESIRCLF
jgi:flagellar motor switch protein FliN